MAQRACLGAELAYPLCPGTFPIVKRKDEAAHGEYRTKHVILEIYEEIQQAMHRGQPYQTRAARSAAGGSAGGACGTHVDNNDST